MLGGAFVGVVLPFVNRRWGQAKYAVFLPSASSLGLALILNPAQSFIIFAGAMFSHFWEKRNATTARGACARCLGFESRAGRLFYIAGVGAGGGRGPDGRHECCAGGRRRADARERDGWLLSGRLHEGFVDVGH